MEDKEIIEYIAKAIKEAKGEILDACQTSIKDALKGVKGSGANIEDIISKKFEDFKIENGFSIAKAPKPVKKPDFKMPFPEMVESMSGKVKILVPNKFVLKKTEANTFHDEDTTHFIAHGKTATALIRKGMADDKEIEVFDPNKKYDFKNAPEIEVEEEKDEKKK